VEKKMKILVWCSEIHISMIPNSGKISLGNNNQNKLWRNSQELLFITDTNSKWREHIHKKRFK
jgi:hypothetical protein